MLKLDRNAEAGECPVSDFLYEPHPDHPGWMTWQPIAERVFHHVIGPIAVRPESEGLARVRWWPAESLGNPRGGVHGGAMLGFVDVALFAGARACGVAEAGSSATIDCSCQFMAPAKLGEPLDALIELLRETKRMAFLRGTLEQGERVAAFSAVIRKIGSQ